MTLHHDTDKNSFQVMNKKIWYWIANKSLIRKACKVFIVRVRDDKNLVPSLSQKNYFHVIGAAQLTYGAWKTITEQTFFLAQFLVFISVMYYVLRRITQWAITTNRYFPEVARIKKLHANLKWVNAFFNSLNLHTIYTFIFTCDCALKHLLLP